MNKEYCQKNKEWLANKAKEDGVVALPKGIYYKVLASGEDNGKTAQPLNVITAHYAGQTIDGKQFDSSYGSEPLTIRLNQLIEGWVIAIQKMHVGDKWELYIPSEMGYGNYLMPGIPGGSTLIFQIELLAIQ